jgi:hypothetical protein
MSAGPKEWIAAESQALPGFFVSSRQRHIKEGGAIDWKLTRVTRMGRFCIRQDPDSIIGKKSAGF